MKKIGIKFKNVWDYEGYESFWHWLDYDFEYEDLIAAISDNRVIELDIEEDEDREEDILMLKDFLKQFDDAGIAYEMFVMNDDWEKIALNEIV
jgi:hypothetical protein